MSVPLVARIVASVPTVCCIKLESLPTPDKVAALKRIWAERPPREEGGRVTILTGLGAL